MPDDWKTIRVPVDAYDDAKAQKDEHGRTWGEQLTATGESESLDVEADDVAQIVVERLEGSKPLEDMAFDDWWEPDYAQTIAVSVVDELEGLDLKWENENAIDLSPVTERLDELDASSSASIDEAALAEALADYLVNGENLPERVAEELHR